MTACRGCGTELPPQTWTGRTRQWCSETCRKAQYGGTCVTCGAPTYGGEGRAAAPKQCKPCFQEAQRAVWPDEAIIAAIRRWMDEHDGRPPTQVDWNPSHACATAEQRAEY